LTGVAAAQDASDSHLAAARNAIKAIGATDQFDPILPQATEALRSELIQKDPNLQADINRLVDEKALEMAGRRADLEAEAAQIYARSFTEAELTSIADFYNSDAGKKLISEGPIVTRELLKAANIWQSGIARDMAEAVGTELSAIAPAPAAEEPKTGN
jgi:hypothetical protein